MRSKTRWFTEICNSHYLSHFAAFFIVTGAKISVVESCLCGSELLAKPGPNRLQKAIGKGGPGHPSGRLNYPPDEPPTGQKEKVNCPL